MILTSPSKDVQQATPVTTTFDAPESRRRRDEIDWERVEQLYSFVRNRALERLRVARQARDRAAISSERQLVHAVDAIFAQAHQRRGVVASCAIRFFRARAMRDAHHPDFLGEWLGAAPVLRSA